MATVIGEFVAKISADMGGFTKGIDKADKRMGTFAKNFAKHRKAIGIGMAALGGIIVGSFGMATKAAADFEAGMREVNTMMGLGQEEFQAMSKDVLKLSKELGVDAVQATAALYQAISAGIPKENVLTFMEIATKAAIGGVTSTEVAVDGLTTVLNAFKIPMKDAQRVADIMFTTVKGGKTTFEELSAKMFNVAPIASSMGISFEEVSAALATMTKQGFPTAQATTAIRMAMVQLQKPTEDMAKAIEDMGYESGQAMVDALGFGGALNKLREHTKGSNEQLMKMFGSVEAGGAVLSLTGRNAQTFRDDLEAMMHATDGLGASTEAYLEVEKGAARQYEKSKEQIKALAIEMGGKLLPVLLPIIEKLSKIVEKVADWTEANPQLAGTIIKVVAVAGGLLVILGGLLFILPGLTTAVGLFGAALALASGPIGWISAGLALITAGAVLLVGKLDKTKDATEELADAIEEVNAIMQETSDTVYMVAEANDTLIDSLADIADGASEVTDAVGDMIAELQFAETTAGRLNISMEDLYGILLRTGTSTEKISELYEEFGDDILNVNKLLQEMGLTAEEAQQHLAQFERITRKIREGPELIVLSPWEAALKKRREERAGLKKMHGGGIVPGSPGQNVPIMAEAGEVITPANRGMNTYNITIEGNVWSEDGLMERFREFLLKTGTDNISTGIV